MGVVEIKASLKTLKFISSIITVLIFILVFLLAGIRIFGFKVYTVLSPSMEPEYPTGSIIYVKKVDVDSLKEKDVITFFLSKDTTATHRIIELVPDENNSDIIRFRTKGDANEIADGSLVEKNQIIGSPVFVIPFLGFIANYIHTPPGLYIAITSAIAIICFVLIVDILSDDKKKSKIPKNN